MILIKLRNDGNYPQKNKNFKTLSNCKRYEECEQGYKECEEGYEEYEKSSHSPYPSSYYLYLGNLTNFHIFLNFFPLGNIILFIDTN